MARERFETQPGGEGTHGSALLMERPKGRVLEQGVVQFVK